jgi:Uma2 family endonuclease
MALHDRSARLTYDDYVLLPEDGHRHEIIDGEHYVTPAPSLRHQAISRRLMLRLGQFIEDHQLGEIYAAPAEVVLSRHDVLQPDLLFVSQERAHILTEPNVQGAPDLIIEILSGSTRRTDQGIKRERYERHGVREYWLADPARDTVTVFRLEDGEFRQAAELSARAEDVLTTPLLPGLEIRLKEIFAA